MSPVLRGATAPDAHACDLARAHGDGGTRRRVLCVGTARRCCRIDRRPCEGRRRRSGIPHPAPAAVWDGSRDPAWRGPRDFRSLRAYRGGLEARERRAPLVTSDAATAVYPPLRSGRTLGVLIGGGLTLALALSLVGWAIVHLATPSAMTAWE